MNRKRLAVLLIISMIFSFVQIPESAQAETQQDEMTAQSQYSASNITKPLNIKYKDRQGFLQSKYIKRNYHSGYGRMLGEICI